MTDALAIRDDSRRSVTWTPAAQALVSDALEAAALIGRVSTPEENTKAVEAQAAVRAAKLEIEKVRKILKEPVLEFGRAIDSTAKQLSAPLEPEEMRLARLLGDYQQHEEAKRKAAEAAILLEKQRLDEERAMELARIAREEGAKRQKLEAEAAEAQRKLNEAKNAEDAKKAEALVAEVKRQQELAQATTLERMDAIQEKFNVEAASLPTAPAPVRAKGQAVTEIVVIDGIREFELMKARPDLVRRIEFDLVEIKRLLEQGNRLAGVTFHKETRSTVRTQARREPLTIGGGE